MGEMETAIFLSIFPDIPSGPEALLVSIARSRVNTSSSVQRIFSGGIVAKSARNFWESSSVREGTAELKLGEKTSLRQVAEYLMLSHLNLSSKWEFDKIFYLEILQFSRTVYFLGLTTFSSDPF